MSTSSAGAARVAARVWGAATAAAGAVTLLRARTVAGLVSGNGPTPDTAVVRILGGRQLLQGTAVLIRPTTLVVIGGLSVDVLHAASMVVAAVSWPGYRRPALVSAVVAGTSAVAGALILRAVPPR